MNPPFGSIEVRLKDLCFEDGPKMVPTRTPVKETRVMLLRSVLGRSLALVMQPFRIGQAHHLNEAPRNAAKANYKDLQSKIFGQKIPRKSTIWMELVLIESSRHVVHSFYGSIVTPALVSHCVHCPLPSDCVYVIYLRRFLRIATSLGPSSRVKPLASTKLPPMVNTLSAQ